MLGAVHQVTLGTSTVQNSNPSPGKPSPKLAKMLQEMSPEAREEAFRITAKLLAIRAKNRILRSRMLGHQLLSGGFFKPRRGEMQIAQFVRVVHLKLKH